MTPPRRRTEQRAVAAPLRHVPVMLEEVMDGLGIRQGGVYLDGTLGEGGHAHEILSRCQGTRVLGLDRDPDAIGSARRRLAVFKGRIRFFLRDYRELDEVLEEAGEPLVDGILLDLGVSSLQLGTAHRGFSFLLDGPLDMRMDPTRGQTAADLVNKLAPGELASILAEYGEERLAKKIAAAVVRERSRSPILTTLRLAEIVSGVPGMGRVKGVHPATRTFQALRIAVNDELDGLKKALTSGVGRLREGGRMAVISFHSLEDRMVKRAFRVFEDPCTCPKELPVCICGALPLGRSVTRRAVRPGEAEVRANPRARSARLRVFERGPLKAAVPADW